MGLQNILEGIHYEISLPSVSSSASNKLRIDTYGHLYNFFRIDESQSFHGLVALKGVDEFYLLMNNLDLLLIAISKVGFEYRLDDSLLTINE